MSPEPDLPLSSQKEGMNAWSERRFVVGPNLGGAVTWLRVLGFDTHYMRKMDEEFLTRCLEEGRIFLTRNRKLGVRKGMTNALVVFSDRPREQLAEIAQRLDLTKAPDFLSRCLRCNERLVRSERGEVAAEVPEFTFSTQQEFCRCPACRRIYWAGTHRNHMMAELAGLGISVPAKGE